jgi:hypothetical protein
MEPLDYTMGQFAVQRMRRQLENEAEAEAEASPTRPARTVHAARGLKRLVAKHRAAAGGPIPVRERG